MNNFLLLVLAFLTGFFGDAILQTLVHYKWDWGLKQYFEQHGIAESMFIAGGMLTFFYIIYIVIKCPMKWYYIAIYGIILDLIFRVTGIFPSLKGYYEHLNYFWSAFWGAIPMLVPFVLCSIIGREH